VPGKVKRTPSTTTYRHGQVVVVNVPFATGSKPRPALVVSLEAFHKKLTDVIVCPVSSQPRSFEKPGPGDVPLGHWKTVGLNYPSTVRISTLLAVEKKLIKRVLGKLSTQDLARVQEGLVKALGLPRPQAG
jgi:mRNA-degrading endonuclease toxin of MazEF toxin-antitoxin module